jgi:hypothetical protein
LPVRFSTARKKLVNRVSCPIDLNNVSQNQLAASSGFHPAVDLNFTALNQQLRLSTRIGNATELQELIQPQGFTFRNEIG